MTACTGFSPPKVDNTAEATQGAIFASQDTADLSSISLIRSIIPSSALLLSSETEFGPAIRRPAAAEGPSVGGFDILLTEVMDASLFLLDRFGEALFVLPCRALFTFTNSESVTAFKSPSDVSFTNVHSLFIELGVDSNRGLVHASLESLLKYLDLSFGVL